MEVKIPEFSYSGLYHTVLDDGYWYIGLLTSGTLRLDHAKKSVDVFLCGGGAGGANRYQNYGGVGGGGGYTTTKYGISLNSQDYWVQVGQGGAPGMSGVATVAFGYSAEGGGSGSDLQAGTGRGGDAGEGAWNTDPVDPKPGGDGVQAFGIGDTYYGAGGGGGTALWWNGYRAPGGRTGGGMGGGQRESGTNGVANTGGGGGGAGGASDESTTGGSYGGSGIVILRGTEGDLLPVFFNGTQLSEIIFNGTKLTGLIKDGTRIFAQMLRRKAAIA